MGYSRKAWEDGDSEAIEREALAEATRAKYDKPDVYLGVLARFPRALTEIAKVSRFGSRKHKVPMGDLSFLEVPEAETVYVKAEARHMLAEAVHGSINIEDGGLLHKAQKAWNALADLEVMLSRCDERALKQAILSGDFPPIKK